MKTFITSLNAKLFNQYGRQFLQGWEAKAASDVELIVCFEGEINELDVTDLQGERYRIIPIASEVQKFFLDKFGKLRELRGLEFSTTPDGKPHSARYNYRFDAIRFSFKIFSFFKCMELDLLKNDFAWIDADIVCKRSFSGIDLQEFFPEGEQLASYLGRKLYPGPNAYSECGFVGYNFSHSMCNDFITGMMDMYLNGNFLLLKEWHDCMVFDYMRTNFEMTHGVAFKNLVAHLPDSPDPFSKSRLSVFFDHLKGPTRKAQLQQQAAEVTEALTAT